MRRSIEEWRGVVDRLLQVWLIDSHRTSLVIRARHHATHTCRKLRYEEVVPLWLDAQVSLIGHMGIKTEAQANLSKHS